MRTREADEEVGVGGRGGGMLGLVFGFVRFGFWVWGVCPLSFNPQALNRLDGYAGTLNPEISGKILQGFFYQSRDATWPLM